MGQHNRTRFTVLAALFVAVMLVLGVFASSALAATVTGDSPASAPLLNDYFGSSLTTGLAGITGAGPNTTYYFKVEMWPGQTLVAAFTPGYTVINLKAQIYITSTNIKQVGPANPSAVLTYTSPIHQMYVISVPCSSAGTFTVDSGIHDFTQAQKISAPAISPKPSHTKYTKISGVLTPKRQTSVTITLKRYSRGTYRSYKVYTVTSNSTSGVFSISKKLPAGSYSVKANTAAVLGYYTPGTSAPVRFKVK